VTSDEEAARVCAWAGELSRASARGHLVLDLRGRACPAPFAASRAMREVDLDRIERSIDACAFEQAEALLRAVDTVSRLSGRPMPDEARRLQAELWFWRGRWHEASTAARMCRAPARHTLGGLILWARGDWRGAGANEPRRLLHATVRPGANRWLVRLVDAEACLWAHRPVQARRALGAAREWVAAPALYRLLHDRVRLAVDRDFTPESDVGARIARSGAHGVLRWGRGRETMLVVEGMARLLELISESEDEVAALAGALRWACDRCGAEEAAIVEPSHSRVIAQVPAGRQPASDEERRSIAAAEVVSRIGRPDGVMVLAPVRYAGTRIAVVSLTGAAEREEALAEGAVNVAALVAPAVRTRLDAIALRDSAHARTPEMVGRSPAMTALREAIVRAAASPFPVLIEGESGSGKELVARAIHRLGARRDRRFAALNCAALTDELAEAELFGHARGAFTGAVGARVGLFEEADGGTLFLDEAGELSSRAQAKLLRALQEREVRRIGENTSRRIDVRIVAATNRSLNAMVAQGAFREDLLFRLAVIRLRVPPLRDRPEDIAPLALRFWRLVAPETGTRAVLGPDALARLSKHPWPGNVRELQNVMAALAVLAPARGRIAERHVGHVLSDAAPAPLPASLDSARLSCERREVAAALARNGGRRTAAARDLGLTRQGLAKAIKRLQLDAVEPMEGVA
jgi:two-component system response regulator HydG